MYFQQNSFFSWTSKTSETAFLWEVVVTFSTSWNSKETTFEAILLKFYSFFRKRNPDSDIFFKVFIEFEN